MTDYLLPHANLLSMWNVVISILLWVSTFSAHLRSWPALARLGFVLLAAVLLLESVTIMIGGSQVLNANHYIFERVALTLISTGLALGVSLKQWAHHTRQITRSVQSMRFRGGR